VSALRIVLAEDEAAVAASVIEQLRGLGHRVVGEAATGREAVRLAEEMRPDMVIMDIRLPDEDGIEAARRIAECSPTPVVFLSGHFDEHLLAGVVDAGGLAYLLKPATSDQLQAALMLAKKRFTEMKDLRAQVARLDQALEARKLVARAKGVLMERHGLSEEEAHRHMQKEASRSNTKLVELARAILTAGTLLCPGASEQRDRHRARQQGEET
jgi:AmiR/NasT family two-component response regulator